MDSRFKISPIFSRLYFRLIPTKRKYRLLRIGDILNLESIILNLKSSLFIVIASCSFSPKEKNVTPAFYHWKTHFSPTEIEKEYLQDFAAKKIYIKFFDVDWNARASEPLPVAEVILDTASFGEMEMVPTVFITNRSLKKYPLEKMEMLAGNIFDKIIERLSERDFLKKI